MSMNDDDVPYIPDIADEIPPLDLSEIEDTQNVKTPEPPWYVIAAKSNRFQDGVDDEDEAPLWLLTFADVMALMLTFFVLLYSMSTLEEKKWESLSKTINKGMGKFHSDKFRAGENDTIEISKLNMTRALDIPYLNSLITQVIAERDDLQETAIFQKDDRLIISLPVDVVFKSGSAEVSVDGKRDIYALAELFGNIRNAIEVVGHTDPNPIQGNGDEQIYKSNRELSLARAMFVAGALRQSGYDRNVIVKGLSSSRFNELPTDVSLARRMDLARRVDIVVMKDSGKNKVLLGFD